MNYLAPNFKKKKKNQLKKMMTQRDKIYYNIAIQKLKNKILINKTYSLN